MPVAGGEGWVPEFEGQRPPFGAGNVAAVTTGAHSDRRVMPLADAHVAALLADPLTPDFLRDPSYARSLLAWGRAEAVVDLLADWLSGQDLGEAMTELTKTVESEEGGKGDVRRKSVSKRMAPVLDQWMKAERLAAHLRAELGLPPRARAGIARDLGAAARAADDAVASLAEQGRAIRERRAAAVSEPVVGGEVVAGGGD